jgi:hypothetical protein
VANPHFIETIPKRDYRLIASVDFKVAEQVEIVSAPDFVDLEETIPILPAATLAANKPWRNWITGCLIAVLALAVAFVLGRHSKVVPHPIYRYALSIPGISEVASLAISPNGAQVVFPGQNQLLYRKYLEESELRAIRNGGR